MTPTEFLLRLQQIDKQKLLDLHGVGDVLADNIVDFIASERFEYLITKFDQLEQNGQSLEIQVSQNLVQEGVLNGQVICITGTFDRPRNQLKDELENLGAKVVDNVTKQTTILLAGESAGSKLDKAKKLSIKICSTIAEVLT
jgi:DNA ligase (NAD+)